MKAKLTLSNIKGYIQAHFRQALDDLDFLPEHIKEQAQWRLKQIAEKSPECLEKDSCVICSCQVSSKVFEDRACEGNCYPEMMTEVLWNKFNLPGKEGTQFKIKLSKDQFSGNMTPEQIEDIAKDLGFYDSGNIKQL